MMPDFSYYKVLGVDQTADGEAVRRAFRRLAKQHHPDTADGVDAGMDFRIIAEAYSILSDPDSRAQYDAVLQAGEASRSAALPGERSRTDGDRVLASLRSEGNFILWEIEDLLSGFSLPGRVPDPRFHPWILPVLRFLDERLLTPAGFPDYFYEARQVRASRYTHEVAQSPNRSGHRPFVTVRDYFYQIRKRMDRMLVDLDRPLLQRATGPGGLSLLECLLEGYRIAYHHLGGIRRILAGTADSVPDYKFTHAALSGVRGALE